MGPEVDWARAALNSSLSYIRYSPFGVDIILATSSTCAAYASLAGGSGLTCTLSRAFIVANTLYYYLGTAAALHMGPAPQCS